ncbi:portal protein [Vibrio phage 1.259.O._10N.286.48.F4]|nr:portal protein [Vibrio phage 1.259.O._10N.286.48.F4]
MTFFGEKTVNWARTELDGLDLGRDKFAEKMLMHTYEKMLFMPVGAIAGDEKETNAVFSSASDRYSPKSHGFVYWTAYAMAKKSNVVLIKEKQQDGSYLFKKDNQSGDEITSNHLVLDFQDYESTDLLKCYFLMMHDALEAAAKGVKTSQGLIIYLEGLKESLADSKAKEIIEGQIKALGEALKGGETGYASGNSKIEFISFDIAPTQAAIDFCYSQVAGHLGLPLSMVNGQGGSSMSDTGESDRKQARKATEFYFLSIIRPILMNIFLKSDFELESELENIEQLSEIVFLIETSQALTTEGKKKLAAQFGLTDDDLSLG